MSTAPPLHSPGDAGCPSPEPGSADQQLAADLAVLPGLDLDALRALWRRRLRGTPPALPRPLLVRLLAYRLQARAFSDLDSESARTLDRIAKESHRRRQAGEERSTAVPPVAAVPRPMGLKPGTVLMRDHGSETHHVMIVAYGFAWRRHHLRQPIGDRPGHHGHALERAALLRSARTRQARQRRCRIMSSLADRNRGAPAKASKPLRCAIYTRKSTEYGLEQEFNSHDNQREAGEAYVKNQAHEGWRPLPEPYDDGGFSGGGLERPALQRLLGEVEAGRVDVVVVYKVDRLTRSLADFAKLVELFDRHGVSFVSVTQAFNTTNSMGRLTLNVLLSFAQFEREVTGERIRDKIAASRRKGMRTGGPVPLGYKVVDKKLVPEPGEAATVRSIFARYLTAGSLGALMAELDAGGVVTKASPRRDGSLRGGVRFRLGSLAALLRNRCYVGEVVHKGRHFPGEHTANVEREIFGAVQAKLTAGARRAGQENRAAPALLTGLIRDSRGHRMTPEHGAEEGAALSLLRVLRPGPGPQAQGGQPASGRRARRRGVGARSPSRGRAGSARACGGPGGLAGCDRVGGGGPHRPARDRAPGRSRSPQGRYPGRTLAGAAKPPARHPERP